MRYSSISPRKQRKALYTASTFQRRRRMTVPLSRELRARFRRRAVPVRKGDTVRVMSGSYVGREERVAKIDRRGYSVTLDNVTGKTADAKLKPLPIRTSHLLLIRLNLSDAWRRRALKVSDEEVTPEELGTAEPTVPEETAGESTPPTEPAAEAPEEAPDVESNEAVPAPKPTRKRSSRSTPPPAEEDA